MQGVVPTGCALILLMGTATASVAAVANGASGDNPEMARIFAADQADRQHQPIDWDAVRKADAARRAATRALLDGGSLRTGVDLEDAAFVFQHGEQPDDYLLAHSLAMAAMVQGRAPAGWIAAATLDRYLLAVDRRQIYGTQYRHEGGTLAREPLDQQLVPDGLRVQLDVPPLAAGDQPSASSAPAAGRSK